MLKKILIISSGALAALLGVLGFVKNSKKLKMRRTVKRVGNAMYTVGTMLRMLSLQVVQKPTA